MERINYLDGLRGLSIISVVLFHSYTRWVEFIPYSSNDSLVDFFSYGWLGVHLFFAISGYVIYMTLIKSKNIFMFGLARYLRLAPAMLVASVLIYFSAFYLIERPLGIPNIQDFIPSITFIKPELLNLIFETDIRSLDGAFWSLYVEVIFYFLVAIFFFFLNDKKLYLLYALWFIWIVFFLLTEFSLVNNDLFSQIIRYLNALGFKYYGWFLIGVQTFKYIEDKNQFTLNTLIFISIITVIIDCIMFKDYVLFLLASSAILIFITPIFFEKIRKILSSQWFVFFGYISYPLYLIHQNIIVALAVKTNTHFPDLPSFMYPLPAIIVVVFLAYLITKIEPTLKNFIQSIFPKKFLGIELLKVNKTK